VSVDEHTIDLAGSPVFYRSAPTVGPPPLYLHGVPTSSDDWIPFLERTGGVAPDLIGFGRSGKGGHLDYSIDGLAEFVERFLVVMEIDRVQLVAHDWGAAPGLVLAQRRPGLVERVVLCNAVPLLDGFHWHRIARIWRLPAVGELAMGATTRRLLARGLRQGSVSAAAWPANRVEAVWRQFDQGTQRAILRLYRNGDEQRLAAAGAELSAVDVPGLVIWGERDPWLSVAYGEHYATTLPHAQLERVADAGHWPWLDRPDVLERVAAFLESP
jgi:pimeloyl-ACP methyl ester carboxylesterase